MKKSVSRYLNQLLIGYSERMSKNKTPWQADSWQNKPALQQPAYPDADALETALARLKTLPPLVTSWEIEALKTKIAAAQRGEAFVLQGGDCAETDRKSVV